MKEKKSCDELMAEYFRLKDEGKNIRDMFKDYSSKNKCFGEDCVRDGTEEEDFCQVCIQRHMYHKKIQRLQYKRGGILRSVRAMVKNIQLKQKTK